MIYELNDSQKEKIKSLHTVPNQKIITVKKDKEVLFGVLGIDNTNNAMSTLKHKAACKLYIWFALNQDEYTFALSQKKACADLKMDKKTYQSGINELIQEGYLIQSSFRKNLYIFHDSPQITPIRGGKITPTGEDENIPKNQVENSNQEQISPTCGTEIPPTCGTEIPPTGEGELPPEISQYNTVNNINNNNIYVSSIEEYNNLPEKKENGNSEIEEHIEENINNSETVLTVDELLPKEENIKDSDTDLSAEESLDTNVFIKDEMRNNLIEEDESKTKARILVLETREKESYYLPTNQDAVLWYLKNKQYVDEQIKKNPDKWEIKKTQIDGKYYTFIAPRTWDTDLPF